MLSLFGFGKRRKVKRSSKKVKACRKPPSRLLKICKKYHVKATKKVGGRRCYKSIAVLKRMCLKKARAMKKKMMKMMKRRKVSKRKVSKRKSVKRKSSKRRTNRMDDEMSFGSRRRVPMFGSDHNMPNGMMMDDKSMFGKRRGASVKVSKAKAMKAFRSFWKRHCKGRKSGFGNGGNPTLSASMGYEFCPNGMGGVLGANSTGLFPSPCVSSSSSGAKAAAFGKRRRVVSRKNRMCSAIGSRRRPRRSSAGKRVVRRTSIGRRRPRRSSAGKRVVRRTAIGRRRPRRSTGKRSAVGSYHRSAAGGVRRRRKRSMV